MEKFIDKYTGDFVHVSTDVYPAMSFMYSNGKIFKQEQVVDLKNYVNKLMSLMNVGFLNADLFNNNVDDVVELIINEHGIHKISLKGKHCAG